MANTVTSYIRETAGAPRRVKQYQGGHNETWGGVTINIDRNYLDLGKGSSAAAETALRRTVSVDFTGYQPARRRDHPTPPRSRRCSACSRSRGSTPAVNGSYNAATVAAVQAWQARPRAPGAPAWTRRTGWPAVRAATRPS